MTTARRKWLLGAVITATALAVIGPAAAQSLSLDLGSGGSSTGRIVQMVVLLTVLSLAPSILVMATSFNRHNAGSTRQWRRQTGFPDGTGP